MAIRLRTVDGIRVALCAVESDPQPGDVYLDDADHGALSCKFAMDYESMGFLRDGLTPLWFPEQEAAMESQKLRDAKEELDLWLTETAARCTSQHG